MEIITENEEETQKEAVKFLEVVIESFNNPAIATVLALCGDLGSGKTVFVKGIAESLGIKERVVSPTFVIERRYKVDNHPTFSTLLHIDAYRLLPDEDLSTLNWRETFKNKNILIVVEWPENIEKEIPNGAFYVYFEVVSGSKRLIKYINE